MRRINHSRSFRRDYRREKRGQYGRQLDEQLNEALQLLAADLPLSAGYRDHSMHGSRAGERNCHIRPDLVLIYSKPNQTDLNLFRLASHSELFNCAQSQPLFLNMPRHVKAMQSLGKIQARAYSTQHCARDSKRVQRRERWRNRRESGIW